MPDGYLGDWLNVAGWAKLTVNRRLGRQGRTAAGSGYHRLVVEENVRLQLKYLSHLAAVRHLPADRPGSLRLHGWVYDIGTGLVKVVRPGDT